MVTNGELLERLDKLRHEVDSLKLALQARRVAMLNEEEMLRQIERWKRAAAYIAAVCADSYMRDKSVKSTPTNKLLWHQCVCENIAEVLKNGVTSFVPDKTLDMLITEQYERCKAIGEERIDRQPKCRVEIYPAVNTGYHAMIQIRLPVGKSSVMQTFAATVKPLSDMRVMRVELGEVCAAMSCCDFFASKKYQGDANCFWLFRPHGGKSWRWRFPKDNPFFMSAYNFDTKEDAWKAARMVRDAIVQYELKEPVK